MIARAFKILGDGDNFIFRSATSDQFINAQGGDDDITLSGNTNDTVLGGSGKDFIDGGAGSDTLSGGSGNDTIFGGAGADHISGGSGDDILNGDNDAVPSTQHGADTIFGGSGSDTIYGGGKADILTGGSSADTFSLQGWLRERKREPRRRGGSTSPTSRRVTTSTFRSWMPMATPPMATARSPCRPQRTPMPERSGSRATTTVSVFFNINGGAADIGDRRGQQLPPRRPQTSISDTTSCSENVPIAPHGTPARPGWRFRLPPDVTGCRRGSRQQGDVIPPVDRPARSRPAAFRCRAPWPFSN